MTDAAAVARAAAAALGCDVRAARPVASGDLNDAFALELAGGRWAFAKTAPDAAPGAYGAEAAGLRWLAEAEALAVPEVLAVADRPGSDPPLLVLGWVEQQAGPPDPEALGRGLARLHAAGAPAFGAPAPGTPPAAGERPAAGEPAATGERRAAGEPPPLRLGPLVLPGDAAADWPAAYADGRLRPLVRVAAARGALPDGTAARLERVCAALPELAGPPEPPARLHGDLWSGNVLTGPRGAPVLIDPAAYGGHREVDLAMLALFGSPSPRMLAAYEQVAPLAEGHADRVPLWQLFPLLVHAALFGGGYGEAVDRAARRYA